MCLLQRSVHRSAVRRVGVANGRGQAAKCTSPCETYIAAPCCLNIDVPRSLQVYLFVIIIIMCELCLLFQVQTFIKLLSTITQADIQLMQAISPHRLRQLQQATGMRNSGIGAMGR